jgi:coproporphyrinogen III oxidase-like Fe-S oxidoreductase
VPPPSIRFSPTHRFLSHLRRSQQEALKTIETGRSLFDEVSFDLIYARRLGHQPSAWREELRRALALGTNHISLYSLAYESGTIFERKMKEGKSAFSGVGSLSSLKFNNIMEVLFISFSG